MFENNQRKERAIVIGLAYKGKPINNAEESLEELKTLTASAGAEVVYSLLQEREARDPAYFIGKGKVQNLNLLCKELGADIAVFDESLSASQRHNLEEILNIKVLDRTQIILDIFAQRARSREGKLQVELAQLKYTASRLIGKGKELSRLGGGIGTRGPGEQKLEVDKRRIKKKIQFIMKELEKIRSHRSYQRQLRKENKIFTFSLVGYTNAGKTTLFNLLTKDQRPADDKLFTTLDPLIRRIVLPCGINVLISDTVGFIHNLPSELITAFKATLEEIEDSSALIHIIDASHPQMEKQIDSVNKILEEMQCDDKTKLLVFNKMDLSEAAKKKELLKRMYPDAVFISAKNSEGINKLLYKLETAILKTWSYYSVELPFDAQCILNKIYENVVVHNRKDSKRKIKLKILSPNYFLNSLKEDKRIIIKSINN